MGVLLLINGIITKFGLDKTNISEGKAEDRS